MPELADNPVNDSVSDISVTDSIGSNGIDSLPLSMPMDIHFNPHNPRAASASLTPQSIAMISKATETEGFSPELLPYLPNIHGLAASLYRTNPEGLYNAPVNVRFVSSYADGTGTMVVVDGDRRLAASRMIQQGFTHPDYGHIHNPSWVMAYLIVDTATDVVEDMSVLLNGSAEMTTAEYFSVIYNRVGGREGLAALNKGERVAMEMSLASLTSRSRSWVRHQLEIIDSDPRLADMIKTSVLTVRAARDLAYQPIAVVDKILNDAGAAISDPAVWRDTKTVVREARAALGVKGAYESVENVVVVPDGVPNTPTTPAPTATAARPHVPKAGRKKISTRKAANPRRTVKELIAWVDELAGKGEKKGKETNPKAQSILVTWKLFMVGEIDGKAAIKSIRTAVGPAPAPEVLIDDTAATGSETVTTGEVSLGGKKRGRKKGEAK